MDLNSDLKGKEIMVVVSFVLMYCVPVLIVILQKDIA